MGKRKELRAIGSLKPARTVVMNFWAAVDNLPNRGLYTRPDATYQGDLYLTDEAAAIHRMTALQVLDVVRRAVMGGQ